MIKELSVEKILSFASNVCSIYDYMPSLGKKYPSRSWLCTIGIYYKFEIHLVNTLAEDEFAKFIADKMDKREQNLIKNKQLEVQATPEFAAMFRESKYRSRNNIIIISLDENGKFYQYLRHHRKRTYKEIEDDKEELKEK